MNIPAKVCPEPDEGWESRIWSWIGSRDGLSKQLRLSEKITNFSPFFPSTASKEKKEAIREYATPENTLDCFTGLDGSISVTPPSINLGESATLTWHVTMPVGCGAMKVFINGLLVASRGSDQLHESRHRSCPR
jgi:hypothetical protein